LPDKKASTCKEAFKYLIDTHQLRVTTLYTDQGVEWKAEFQKYIDEIDKILRNDGKEFKKLSTLPVSPHMNGMVENLNRIKKLCECGSVRILNINSMS